MCSALNCVYFHDQKLDVDALHRKASRFRKEEKVNFRCFPQVEDEHESGELIAFSHEDIRTNLDLSFFRLRKSAKKWKKYFQKMEQQPVVVLRNERLFSDYEEFTSKVENNEFHYGEFFQFLKTKYSKKISSTQVH